ncbi:MAG: hypothetical protein ACLRPW_04895 [Intestinibacter sp.]
MAERGFLDGVNGSCHIPMAAYCEIIQDKIHLTGLYGDSEGKSSNQVYRWRYFFLES